MSGEDSLQWEGLLRAREKLTAQLGDCAEISLIDIGIDPEFFDRAAPAVLRVHVRKTWTPEKVPVPELVDGMRVIVIVGDYQLE